VAELVIDRPRPDLTVVAPPGAASQRYINRELSWLAFNERVLDEASNTGHPLLERVRFLSISDSNLDEFYMVRVAGLQELAESGITVKSDDGLTPEQQLIAIAEVAGGLVHRQQRCWVDLQKRLRGEGISIVDHDALTVDDRSWLRQLFIDRLLPVMTPIAIDPAHPFPFIPNRTLAMVVEFYRDDGSRVNALVLVPERVERFIRLPGKEIRFISVEEVLLAVGLLELFPGMAPRRGLLRCHSGERHRGASPVRIVRRCCAVPTTGGGRPERHCDQADPVPDLGRFADRRRPG
jgi:polyphosphate kinase